MELKKALPCDVERAVTVIEEARRHLREQGIDQWQQGQPNREMVEQDLAAGKGYLLLQGDTVAGYVCIDPDGEPVYEQLNGAWRGHNYAAVHRVAIGDAFRGKGYAALLFSLAEEICRAQGKDSMRIDTHKDNKKMQFVLGQSGFVLRGGIVYEQAGARLAFEKCMEAKL